MSRKDELFSIFETIDKNSEDANGSDPDDSVMIVDGMNTFIRTFACTPTMNEDGDHIGGITGFINSLSFGIKRVNPTRVIIPFDGKGGSQRRRKIYSDYKGQRKSKTNLNRTYDWNSEEEEAESRKLQLIKTVEFLQCLPVTTFAIDNIEADDAIAYIISDVLPESQHTIMSTDKDFLQLIDDDVSVWRPTSKKLITKENIEESENIPASNLLFTRIFEGDTSDNINGVKGIGRKRMKKLFPFIKEDDQVTLNQIYDYAEENKEDGSVYYEKILNNKDIIERNYKLMQLFDVDISGRAKTKVIDNVNKPIPRLNAFEFKKMYMRDKMWTAIPSIDSWLRTNFNYLDAQAAKTHNEDEN